MRLTKLLFPILLLLSACGQETSYKVSHIAIAPQTVSSYMGATQDLPLQVTDTRTNAVVGYHRFGFEKESPVIVPDMATYLLNALQTDLRNIGLKATAYNFNASPALDIKITSISYENKGRVITGDEQLLIRAEATANKNGRVMTKIFESKSYDQDLMIPSVTRQKENIDKGVSKGLEKIVYKIINDHELINFIRN